MEISSFSCTICGEASTEICVYCTKDTCANHLCDRCRRCSDCCECALKLEGKDVLLDEGSPAQWYSVPLATNGTVQLVPPLPGQLDTLS